MYIKLPDTFPYPIGRFRADHRDTSFPAELTDVHYAAFGVHKVRETPKPDYDAATQNLSTSAEFINGEWVQTWAISQATAEEIAQRVPSSVTMRQARLALLGAGKLSMVEAAIDAMPEPDRSAARIEWEYSGEVQRHNSFVAALGPALGLSSVQIDALFYAAAKL